MSHKAKELHNSLEKLQNIPANKKCADCTKTITQRWAIFPWAVFICSECAAVHRRMGTHISKTKCISLDTLSEEEVELLKSVGNKIGNTFYEAKLSKAKPTTTSEHYLREKYDKKMFMAKGAEQGAKAIIEGRVEAVATVAPHAEETRTVPPSTASSNIMVKKPAPTINTTPVQKKNTSSGLADDFLTFSPTSTAATSTSSSQSVATSAGKQEKEEAKSAILSLFDSTPAPAAVPQVGAYPPRPQQIGIPMQPVYRPAYVVPNATALPPGYTYRAPTWNPNTR